jgi:hypothetical protein
MVKRFAGVMSHVVLEKLVVECVGQKSSINLSEIKRSELVKKNPAAYHSLVQVQDGPYVLHRMFAVVSLR